jgi:hypothetical protein
MSMTDIIGAASFADKWPRDSACAVTRADDGAALAFRPDSDVELIHVPHLLEENGVQLFVVAVDRQ